MDNEFTRKEKICPLAGDYCDERDKCCNDCIDKEDAWTRLQYYMDLCNYDWTYDHLKHDYQTYYIHGYYCSDTFKDIVENNKTECELLFEKRGDK